MLGKGKVTKWGGEKEARSRKIAVNAANDLYQGIRVLGFLGHTCSINKELHSRCRGRTNVPSNLYFATLLFPSIKKNNSAVLVFFSSVTFLPKKTQEKKIYGGCHLIQERY